MSSMNLVILAGNTGRDPELKVVSPGDYGTVAKFSLAVERVKKGGGSEVEWINIACWGKLADTVAKHVGKGSFIIVEGQLVLNRRDDEAGKPRYYPEIRANRVTFGSLKPISTPTTTPTQPAQPTAEPDWSAIEDDDIPF